ncbi:UBX domain-containing protein 6 isoform X2 [Ambystoma mexicanum]|uniref:UBX domain-containing protein 6 isoform X2 n=1 Tax=Ambystoma mexicanum TaxID=8296 RepID=UPI0037E88A9A
MEKVPNEKIRKETQRSSKAPSEGAQMAATAALARIELKQAKAKLPTSQEMIRTKVKRELEAEAAAAVKPRTSSTEECQEIALQPDNSVFSVSGVYFTCPLTGATLRKNQRDAHIKEAILLYFSEDPISASIMKIHTFNKDIEKVKLGTETVAKYLENIHKHPEEEKYRRIRLSNRIFQERISSLEGAPEFFQAIGFEKKMLPVSGQENEEEFYVLKEELLGKLDDLEQYRENLLSGEPVKAMLDRNMQIFQPSIRASQFELPEDFYSLSTKELEREQKLRAEATERNSMLRTKAMREKEEKREMRKYNYTLLRVRLPDGLILQGTFYAREKMSALMEFVRSTLENDWMPFELLGPGGLKLEDENTPFNECGLVPAALLTFQWDTGVIKDIEAAGAQSNVNVLKPEHLAHIQTLS